MTINHKMTAPKEMATEVIKSTDDSAARANRRMARICATPEEIDKYCYDPLGASANLRPGIPCHDEYPSYED